MESKYNGLSGKEILTFTPYGLLMQLIIYNKVVIYIQKIDGNTYNFSLDEITWRTLNKKLGKELYELSSECENIKIWKSL